MDAHALEVLEFEKVRQMLAEKAASALGREAALHLEPKRDLAEVQERQALTTEMRKAISFGEGLGLEGVKDIRSPLWRLKAEGVSLSGQELLDVASTLGASRRAKRFIEAKKEHLPRLADRARGMATFEGIEKAIANALSLDGEVLDRASEALKKIRRETVAVRGRIHDKLSALLSSPAGGKAAQEPIITVRENRYVIPVRTEEKGRIRGIVHDTSSSGATVFLEPLATVELNNQLRELAIAEQREIERILAELSDQVRQLREPIQRTLGILAEMDLLYAQALLADSLSAVEPLLNDAGRMKITMGRHPLLVRALGKDQVVPLAISLGDGFTMLVITGPNTGGKTVALKTVGLLVLMAQAGLAVPAGEGTELAVFHSIYADIGDEQSIEQSLSTFSSHIREVAKVLREADDRSLVLLDEVGVGTDPNEGAALAMSVLEELNDRGARVLATTHYGSLKVFAHSHPGMENASMEFDRETLSPSFRLQIGVPGGSYAMEIAERLGLSREVIATAKRLISREALRLDELIQSLETKVRQAEAEREALAVKGRDLERDKLAYEAKLRDAKAEVKEIREKAREEARALIRGSKQEVEKILVRVREEQATRETALKASHALAEEERKVANEEEMPEVVRKGEPLISPQVGEKVWVESLHRDGVLVSLSNNRARVETGGIRLDLPLAVLSRAKSKEEAQGGTVTFDHDREFSPELMLIGLRSNDALEQLDHYLDQAELVGIRQVRIVHGKGSGVLRKNVGEVLERDQRVRSHRLGEWDEGGSGVTIVELR